MGHDKYTQKDPRVGFLWFWLIDSFPQRENLQQRKGKPGKVRDLYQIGAEEPRNNFWTQREEILEISVAKNGKKVGYRKIETSKLIFFFLKKKKKKRAKVSRLKQEKTRERVKA